MSLTEARRTYQAAASYLGDYRSISKWELAHGYSVAQKNNDRNKMNYFFGALMDRYWYKIPQWILNSASLHLPPEEFVHWLEDSLLVAFRWELGNPDSSIYDDPNGPDKVINRCCFSTRGREYQYYNKDKRKNDAQAVSIYQEYEDGDDSESFNLLDNVASTKGPRVDGAKELINLFLSQHNPVGAMILDGVAYQNAFKENREAHYIEEKDSQGRDIRKKYIGKSEAFDMRRLVKHLRAIDKSFIYDYFCKKYDIRDIPKDSLIDLFGNMNYSKIHRSIERTFKEIRNSEELKGYLL